MPDEPKFIPPKVARSSDAPVQPKDPPKEILSQTFEIPKDLSFSDNTSSRVVVETKDGIEKPLTVVEKPVETPDKTVVEKPVIEKLKEEEKKTESKLPAYLKPPKSAEEPKVEDKSTQVSKPKAIQVKQGERDYTGFALEEVVALKQMSNEAFSLASKVLKENKELKGKKSELYFQHPEAYTLSPEFRQLQTRTSLFQQEGDIWNQLLNDVKLGKKIRPIEGFDPKTGQWVFSKNEIEPSSDIEEKIRGAMNQCFQAAQTNTEKLRGYGQTYNEQVKKDLSFIDSERLERFDWVKNPELVKYTLPMEMGDGTIQEKSIDSIRNDFKSIFPHYLQGPSVEVAADLMVSLVLARAEINDLKQKMSITEIKSEELKRGEPSSQIRPSNENPVVGKVREFSLADLPR